MGISSPTGTAEKYVLYLNSLRLTNKTISDILVNNIIDLERYKHLYNNGDMVHEFLPVNRKLSDYK